MQFHLLNINFFLNRINNILYLIVFSMENEKLNNNNNFVNFFDMMKSKLKDFLVLCQEEITALNDIIRKLS